MKQERTLGEIGNDILREADPEKRAELREEWHREHKKQTEKYWHEYHKQQGVFTDDRRKTT